MMADATIGVGALPGRKQPALWVARDGEIRVLAYFRDESALAEFLSWKPTTMTTPPPPFLRDVTITAVASPKAQKIQAIKQIRSVTGFDLKAAKAASEGSPFTLAPALAWPLIRSLRGFGLTVETSNGAAA